MTPVVRLIFSASAETIRKKITPREMTMFWRMIARARRLRDERLLDILNLVVHQDHVGLFQRCIGSASAHAERDIRGGQARRIVHRSGKRIVANASQS